MNQVVMLDPPLSMQDRLRQTALELFSTNGYQSTSMRDLASHLGIHAGSIYSHVKCKQDLLFELIEDVLEDLLSESKFQVSKQRTFGSKLSKFVETYIRIHATERQSLALLEREAINLAPAQRKRIEELKAEYVQILCKFIIKQPEYSNISSSVLMVLAQSIIGMLQGLFAWHDNEKCLAFNESALVRELTRIIGGAISAAGKVSPRNS